MLLLIVLWIIWIFSLCVLRDDPKNRPVLWFPRKYDFQEIMLFQLSSEKQSKNDNITILVKYCDNWSINAKYFRTNWETFETNQNQTSSTKDESWSIGNCDISPYNSALLMFVSFWIGSLFLFTKYTHFVFRELGQLKESDITPAALALIINVTLSCFSKNSMNMFLFSSTL